ncbi:hypothetical protein FK535_06280 [Mycolicibacterium sp. 018/SC-01/001]|uniref:CGNR zinc finger domain-containing protein n=1 Tax=Mycolicibacterium sp. 018/SC-01/001 TaxID=2592069 RepID=UPI00117ECF2D|nr:CGNR zinc finger domain-containing protein [Mycolicibacterium sp. 018/SC-01/001]TRW88028.1 hypothetical protein FK535_06280 [Mycolicibacterium sp. 018/SC-01/001]
MNAEDPGRYDPREVVTAFANTHVDGGGSVERFGDEASLIAWAHEQRWFAAESALSSVTEVDAAQARELRDALVVVLLAHSRDARVSDAEVREAEMALARAGERFPVFVHTTVAGVRLRDTGAGVSRLFSSVLVAVAELSLSGQWGRMKACRNQPCHLAFVDRTRNTSATFCSPQCASQSGMRDYRARKRADKRAGGK